MTILLDLVIDLQAEGINDIGEVDAAFSIGLDGAIERATADSDEVVDALGSLDVTAVVVAGIEEADIVLLHEAVHHKAGSKLGAQVGEYQQVGRAEGIATEAIMGLAVDKGGRT